MQREATAMKLLLCKALFKAFYMYSLIYLYWLILFSGVSKGFSEVSFEKISSGKITS